MEASQGIDRGGGHESTDLDFISTTKIMSILIVCSSQFLLVCFSIFSHCLHAKDGSRRCRLLADGTIASWALLTNRHLVSSHNNEIAQGFVDFCQLRPRPASEHLRLHERFGLCLIIVKRCSN
ncbi:uncharacterized protein LOC126620834 isoform X2 [Malus sylvestris]|nr:uncharacterized protein LOC126620834 isoform X2 [Malus sylvestris]XP_050145123.1 uncharacterized protein LOC126620834 isoform X3 [Malus sylvestris]XP_050145124.1 uncharacterized protein LOC126620834 isoform X2 [Malus sylvestris]